jgi:hypothetical protein
MFVVALLLLLYRWLTGRHRTRGLIVYGLIVVAFIPATIVADRVVIGSGALSFGRWYTVWWDAAMWDAFLVLLPASYEASERWLRRNRPATSVAS